MKFWTSGLIATKMRFSPCPFRPLGAMDVTKTYKFIGFGAMDVIKPYEFIGHGAMDVTKPCEIIGFGPPRAQHPCPGPPGGGRTFITARMLGRRRPFAGAAPWTPQPYIGG